VIKGFQSAFNIPELRRRILYTLGILIVYLLGGHIPAAGIDGKALSLFFSQQRGTILGLYDMFVGGNLSKATVFALGIMPYISASIILQLLTAVIPYFEKLKKEGEEGRRKINQYTRYGTVLVSVIQAYGISIFLESMRTGGGMPVVPNPGWPFRMLSVLTLTSGTILVMWLGEQITERGIGNGISLIITIGIVARYPGEFLRTISSLKAGTFSPFQTVLLFSIMVAVTGLVVLITQGTRKLPVQYAKRIVGRKIYGGHSTFIPLRVNTAGVIPVIFAQSLLMFPRTLATTFFPGSELMEGLAGMLEPGAVVYAVLYSGLIVFFAYFYTAIIFNPVDLADNMKRQGAFIPGKRPGKSTSEFIDRVLTRITLPGAIFLAFIALLPDILIYKMNAPVYFGGTGLLIVVGVILDTLQQIESHLLMRHYDSFMKKGRIRGRV
jgi:preprotein translocase subunit SecY